MLHWIKPTSLGLYCEPGQFYIDPQRSVDFAIITHGHADHARAGHDHVLATPATHAIMRLRLGINYTASKQALDYHETIIRQQVQITLLPAGHILGSAQVLLSYKGQKVVISGDYKRRYDPTCTSFQPHACDLFITEATFGLPIFRHPPIANELLKLTSSLQEFPDRCHVVGVYALGKAQRLISSLRQLGYDKPIYIHNALHDLCELYRFYGSKQENLLAVHEIDKRQLAGEIVLAPPSVLRSQWVQELPYPMLAMASGWMQIRARNKTGPVELPLIISDHADWDELSQTIADIKPNEVWVTHGDERALVHHCQNLGVSARPLRDLRLYG
jgi:putative mRNA 3-end processing factor